MGKPLKNVWNLVNWLNSDTKTGKTWSAKFFSLSSKEFWQKKSLLYVNEVLQVCDLDAKQCQTGLYKKH